MHYWGWAAIGAALIIMELITPSFIMVFLGVGAVVAAVTTATGLTEGLGGQIIVFSVISLTSMLLFRNGLKKRFIAKELMPDYVGQQVRVTKAIPAGNEGRVMYRGSEWIAFCEAHEESIPEGGMAEVTGSDGIRLKVKQVAQSNGNTK